MMRNAKKKIRTPWQTLVTRAKGDTKKNRKPGKLSLSTWKTKSSKSTPTPSLLKNRPMRKKTPKPKK